jgi:hypothetical protein
VDFSLSGVSLAGKVLQLHAAAGVQGLTLRAVRSAGAMAPSAGNQQQQQQQLSPSSNGPDSPLLGGARSPIWLAQPPLVCLTASWQSFECSLAPHQSQPKPLAQQQQQQGHPPPAAISLRCQSTDVSLQLEAAGITAEQGGCDGGHATGGTTAAETSAASDSGLPSQEQAQPQLCVDAHINAMHTSVGYEALPALIAALLALQLQLREQRLASRGSAAPEQGPDHPATNAASAAASNSGQLAEQEAVSSSEGPPGRFLDSGAGAARAAGAAEQPAAEQLAGEQPAAEQLRQWRRQATGLHINVRLGQGSSLRFVDAASSEQWVSSIESARLIAVQQAQRGAWHAGGSGTSSNDPGGASTGSSPQLALDFEVQQIAMHAVHAGQHSVQQHPVQQVLATKLLRLNLQHRPGLLPAGAAAVPTLEPYSLALQGKACCMHASKGAFLQKESCSSAFCS